MTRFLTLVLTDLKVSFFQNCVSGDVEENLKGINSKWSANQFLAGQPHGSFPIRKTIEETLQAGDDESAGTSLGTSELANKRVDGAKGKIAPLLRGEGNWPDKGAHTSFTKRILLCVDAMLGDLPFWLQVS